MENHIFNMKRYIIILFLSLFSILSYSQNIYEGTSTFSSSIVANVKNGYVYLKNSTMYSDLMYYFDGKYVYRLNKSKSYSTNDIVLTYKDGYIYKGKSLMYSDIKATWYQNRLYYGKSTMDSDVLVTYLNNKIYNGRSTMQSNIICTTSLNIHPAILYVILTL